MKGLPSDPVRTVETLGGGLGWMPLMEGSADHQR